MRRQAWQKGASNCCRLCPSSLKVSMFGLLLVLLVNLCDTTYDLCNDDNSGADLACQPSMLDIIWYETFKLSVAPSNATCGTPVSVYRRLGDRNGANETCDASSPSLQHPPNFMVDNGSTWWQSVTQPANSNDLRVNVTFSFNKTFVLAGDIIITFNSGRPQQMVLEKSRDYGQTWTPLQFYARNCSIFADQYVPGATVTAENPTAVTCTNRFVETVTRPPAGQKLKFAVDERFNLFLGASGVNFANFYSALDNKMSDFLKFTDLRLRLIKPANDGRTSWETYYYGISDLQITAWCDCNLHAAYCNYTETAVVCDCQHNTAGPDCGSCLPLYNERLWMAGLYLPFDTGTANECQKCECNEHALSCTYNSTYGRGVCQDCLHNTRGYHCQLCVPTYYPNVSLPLSDVLRCIDCDCDPVGVYNNSFACAQEETSTQILGQCPCRALIAGRRCDQCVSGYYGLKDGPTPGNCTVCGCNLDGTMEQSNICQQSGGQCPCKATIVGRECGTCADGYFSFPTGNPRNTCLPCGCDLGGSKDNVCNKTSGQCSCRTGLTGVRCNQASPGTFVPALDSLKFEPQSSVGCPLTSDRLTPENPFDGPGFAVCNVTSTRVSLSLQSVLGAMTQKDVQWPYIVAVRYSTQSSILAGSLVVEVKGNTDQNLTDLSMRLGRSISAVCPVAVGTRQLVTATFYPGVSTASLSRQNNVTIDVRCQYSLTLELYLRVDNGTASSGTAGNGTTGNGTAGNGTAGNGTASNGTAGNETAGNGTAGNGTAGNGTAGNGTASNGTAGNETAGNGTAGNGTAGNGTASNGTAGNETAGNGTAGNGTAGNGTAGSGTAGSGTAGSGISSRRKRAASQVSASSINIDSLLLLPGLSNSDGSIQFELYNKSDNQTSTQESYLSCLQQLSALTQRQKALTESPCREIMLSVGAELTDGSVVCGCSPDGTEPPLLQTCQALGGQCQCKPGVSGLTCNSCTPGYFNLTTTGCTPCNCNPGGAKSLACDMTTGQCPCHPNIAMMTDAGNNSGSPNEPNVNGTCSVCLAGFYGVSSKVGCAQCLCNQQGSTSLQCDETGQCPCRDTVTGQKCDVCRDGFFGFSSTGCSTCNCSVSGSTTTNCDQDTGMCSCRTNVQGDKCASCKAGFFNLASHNPHGCQPCFCYGHGGSCVSANGFVEKMLMVTDPTSSSQMNVLLGDLHISYGLNLSLGLSAEYGLDLYNQTLISFSGRGKVLFHAARNGTLLQPGKGLVYVVPILEDNWILEGEGHATTALDVLEMLSNVSEVKLITRSQGHIVMVTNLTLQFAEKVTNPATLAPAGNVTFVEQCSCNISHNVTGLSCEKCSVGYRRPALGSISSYTTCELCDCHARGTTDPPECQEDTGLCLNCRNGTTGEHCESCAAFVEGDECDRCSSSYWGLQADGCRACNCSSPASLNTTCDQLTGQCSCASHVSGLTCGQCEENFHDISASGCTECDDCYSLMKQEIVPLRVLRDSISSNVSLIDTRDRTKVLGAFSYRLGSAVMDTEQLIRFLESVERSASEVNSKMTSFNQTLVSVLQQMTEVENMSLTVEQGLVTSDKVIKLATTYRTTMEAAVRNANTGIGNLQTQAAALTQLTKSLNIVESYLQSLTNASTTNQEIFRYLASLNQSVVRAGQLVSDVSQKSQDALRAHQTSTGQLLALESLMVSVVSLMSGTLSASQSLQSHDADSKATQMQLQNLLTEVTSYSIDFLTMADRTKSAQLLTSSFLPQVMAESALFSPLNIKALQSVSQLEPFVNVSLSLSSTASVLLWRANNSQQRCATIKNESTLLLASAQNILATANNFSDQATAIQKRANTSLSQLGSQDVLSQQLIDQSDNLTKALTALRQNASAAKGSSQQALQIVLDKQQKLSNLSSQADRLHERLGTLVEVGHERYKDLNSTRNNILSPGGELCISVNVSVSQFKDKISMAESLTSLAAQKVSNVTQKANQVLASLMALARVDTGSTLSLLEQVLAARSSVDVGVLKGMINQLATTRDMQRSQISRLNATRATLRDKVASMQLFLG